MVLEEIIAKSAALQKMLDVKDHVDMEFVWQIDNVNAMMDGLDDIAIKTKRNVKKSNIILSVIERNDKQQANKIVMHFMILKFFYFDFQLYISFSVFLY